MVLYGPYWNFISRIGHKKLIDKLLDNHPLYKFVLKNDGLRKFPISFFFVFTVFFSFLLAFNLFFVCFLPLDVVFYKKLFVSNYFDLTVFTKNHGRFISIHLCTMYISYTNPTYDIFSLGIKNM